MGRVYSGCVESLNNVAAGWAGGACVPSFFKEVRCPYALRFTLMGAYCLDVRKIPQASAPDGMFLPLRMFAFRGRASGRLKNKTCAEGSRAGDNRWLMGSSVSPPVLVLRSGMALRSAQGGDEAGRCGHEWG